MVMMGRKFDSDKYRYGFNGKEKDKDIAADNYDFGARIYDGRIGRWLSVDPLQAKYPGLSPYNFVANSPVLYVDPDGRIIRIYYDGDKYLDYTPGMKLPFKNAILEKVAAAAEYNMHTPIGKEVWNQLASSEAVVEIYVSAGPNTQANGGNERGGEFKSGLGRKTRHGNQDLIGTINWDSDGKYEVFEEGSVKGYFAPSTVLFHELGHAQEAEIVRTFNDLEQVRLYNIDANEYLGRDPQYDTKEERLNTTTREHTYIRQINAWEQENSDNPSYQPIRYNHRGQFRPWIHEDVNRIDPSTYNEWRSKHKNERDGIKDKNDSSKM
jgi:RHS repeat-associated protein